VDHPRNSPLTAFQPGADKVNESGNVARCRSELEHEFERPHSGYGVLQIIQRCAPRCGQRTIRILEAVIASDDKRPAVALQFVQARIHARGIVGRARKQPRLAASHAAGIQAEHQSSLTENHIAESVAGVQACVHPSAGNQAVVRGPRRPST